MIQFLIFSVINVKVSVINFTLAILDVAIQNINNNNVAVP
jgi:hypothetical protein